MIAQKFEIGLLYHKFGCSDIFLAIDKRLLLTIKDGRAKTLRAHSNYKVAKNISINELCEQWKITTDELDKISASFLAPLAESRTKKIGSKRESTDKEAQRMKNLRLAKIVV